MSLTPENAHRVAQQQAYVASEHQTKHSDTRRTDMTTSIMKKLCLTAVIFAMVVMTASAQTMMRSGTDGLMQGGNSNFICGNPQAIYPDSALSESQEVEKQNAQRFLEDGTEVSVEVLADKYVSLGSQSDIAVVDWVQVDLRAAPSNTAPLDVAGDASLTVARVPALLLSDSRVVDPMQTAGEDVLDGVTIDQPDSLDQDNQDVYVVIHHRNHLSIMSAESVNDKLDDEDQVVDFTKSSTPTYGGDAAVKEVSPAIYAMRSGNADNNEGISFLGDVVNSAEGRDVVATLNERNVYTGSDLNLDSQVGFLPDLVGKWVPNANVRPTITGELRLGSALSTIVIPPQANSDLPCYFASSTPTS